MSKRISSRENVDYSSSGIIGRKHFEKIKRFETLNGVTIIHVTIYIIEFYYMEIFLSIIIHISKSLCVCTAHENIANSIKMIKCKVK